MEHSQISRRNALLGCLGTLCLTTGSRKAIAGAVDEPVPGQGCGDLQVNGASNQDTDCGIIYPNGTVEEDADCGKISSATPELQYHNDADCFVALAGMVGEGRDADCGIGSADDVHRDEDCGKAGLEFKNQDGDCGKANGATGQPHPDSDCANSNGPGNYNSDADCGEPSTGTDSDCGTRAGPGLTNVDGSTGVE